LSFCIFPFLHLLPRLFILTMTLIHVHYWVTTRLHYNPLHTHLHQHYFAISHFVHRSISLSFILAHDALTIRFINAYHVIYSLSFHCYCNAGYHDHIRSFTVFIQTHVLAMVRDPRKYYYLQSGTNSTAKQDGVRNDTMLIMAEVE